MPLTDVAVKNLVSRTDGKPLKVSDGAGLYLWVMPNGSKYWRFKYRFAGKEKLLALGVYPDVSLKDARAAAGKARTMVAEGGDPCAEVRLSKLTARSTAANRFEDLAVEWMQLKAPEWSPKHAVRVLSSFQRHIFPSIGDSPASEIEPLMLLEALRRIELAGNVETARKLREWCSAIFRLGIVSGRCSNDPAHALVDVMRSKITTPRKSLAQDQIGGFLKALIQSDCNRQTKLGMLLALHCFTRVGELASAEWSEVDFDAALWTIPPEHRKLSVQGKLTGDPHLVPLSKQALEFFRGLHEFTGHRVHVFPNMRRPTEAMSPETFRRLLHRLGFRGKADVHGFRAMASSILNEQGFNPDAIERQLSHKDKDKVRSAYNRAAYMEERRKMMQWWSDHLDAHLVSDRPV